MNKKIFATAAAAVFAASTAMAQTPGTHNMGQDWTDDMADAFFDEENGMRTLRSESDIESSWDDLSAADQAQIRAECAMRDADLDAGQTTTPGEAPAPGEATLGAGEAPPAEAGAADPGNGDPAAPGAGAAEPGAAGTPDAAGATTPTTPSPTGMGAITAGQVTEADWDELCEMIEEFDDND